MEKHRFDGSRSGSGETCFAEIDGEKCIQREGHPIHQVPKGNGYGPYQVVVTHWSEDVLEWSGDASNVSDALHKALDKREEELGGEE